MNFLEAIMQLCFEAAWPFSIYQSYTSRATAGKSPIFQEIPILDYIAGVLHKIFVSYDYVLYLYILI